VCSSDLTISTPTANVTITSGGSVSFAGSATDSSSQATLSYAWSFGDGATATGTSASHVFTNTGSSAVSYTVTFTATDNTGASGKATRVVTVNPKAAGSFAETFESGTKGSYATGSITFASGSWTLNDALVGTSSSDAKNGSQSVRLRNSGKLTMGFNLSIGAKAVTVAHGLFGSDTGATWGLWYSTNGGSTWTQAGSMVTTSSSSLATATFTLSVSGTVRFEIRKTDGSSNRLNIDDFKVAGF
jgi:endonuclease G